MDLQHSRMWVTVVKDKLNHPYYTSLIGCTFRLRRIVVQDDFRIKNRRMTRQDYPKKGESDKTKIYFGIAAKSCFYEEGKGHAKEKFSLWEFDELKHATPEEVYMGRMLEGAEKI